MEASHALKRGTQFLLERQGGDGLWRDFLTPAGAASEWPTGFIGAALHRAGAQAGPLERAAESLVTGQGADGGWGYNERVPTDADSTAYALLFLAELGRREEACQRAAACLLRHQGDDGGVATYSDPGPIRQFMGVGRWVRFDGWCRPHTEVTATAGRALAAVAGGAYRREAAAAWRYVRPQQRDDGSWTSYWWTSPHYTTLHAAQLAVSLGDDEAVSRAAAWALRSQSDDGAWRAPGDARCAFTTALSLSLLCAADLSGRHVERAVSSLVSLQDDDGGWPSRPVMRIPIPGDVNPDRRRRLGGIGWLGWLGRFGRGVVVGDQHRTFTTAACVAALAAARDATA